MTVICFPDTTVLINFGYTQRHTLLEQILPNPTWCYTVASECADQYDRHGFTTYPDVQAIFGKPLAPDRAEAINTRVLRDSMAKPTDKPDAHFGEAETIAIIQSRTLRGSIFVTDDNGATKLAQEQGISTLTTWTLLKTAVNSTKIQYSDTDAWADAQTLNANQRGWPKGIQHTQAAFNSWLTSR